MEEGLISIIVPIYNTEEYLLRCVNSLRTQVYSRLEIILVDDGSTDGSGELCDRLASEDARIRVLHKENGGSSSARNLGISVAKGEYIGFVDSDDFIEPDMYERLLKNAWTYGAEVSHCGVQMVFPDGRVHFFYNTGKLEKQDRMTALRELLSGKRIEPGLWNKLFHRELFERLLNDGIMPADIRINEDLLMNFYLFSAAEQTVYEDWCPYHYIVRQTSASREKLNEHNRIQSFEVGIKSSSQFRYKEDWDLGDVVTGKQTEWGVAMDQRITEVEEVFEGDAMSVTPTMGTPAPETYNLEDNIE